MSAYKCSPCFGCKDRVLGCHAICRLYSKFKYDLDMVSKEKNKDCIIKDYVLDVNK